MSDDIIRVIVLKDGDIYVAQCLEFDIGAQAADLESLRARLDAAINAERREGLERHGRAFAGIDPAPGEFFAMWDRLEFCRDTN